MPSYENFLFKSSFGLGYLEFVANNEAVDPPYGDEQCECNAGCGGDKKWLLGEGFGDEK